MLQSEMLLLVEWWVAGLNGAFSLRRDFMNETLLVSFCFELTIHCLVIKEASTWPNKYCRRSSNVLIKCPHQQNSSCEEGAQESSASAVLLSLVSFCAVSRKAGKVKRGYKFCPPGLGGLQIFIHILYPKGLH